MVTAGKGENVRSNDITSIGTSDVIGAHAFNGGSIDITGDVYLTGEECISGVIAGERETDIEGGFVSVGGSITVSGDRAYGVIARNEGVVTVGGNVIAKGVNLRAIDLETGSALISGDVSAIGDNSWGAFVMKGSDARIDGNLKVEGDNSYGMQVSDSKISIGGDLSTSGDKSIAAYLISSDATIEGSIKGSGENIFGAKLFDKSSLTVGGEIRVEGKNAHGAIAEGSSSLTVGGSIYVDGEHGVAAKVIGGSKATIDGYIYVSGDNSHGAIAESRSTISLDGFLWVEGDNAVGASAGYESTISISGDVLIDGEGSTAFVVSDGGTINLDNSLVRVEAFSLLKTTSGGNLNATNGSQLFGDVVNGVERSDALNFGLGDDALNFGLSSELNIDLSGGSSLHGSIRDIGDNNRTDLTINGAGDSWYVTGDSKINGTLVNNGLVDYTQSALGTEVTIANLSDHNGIFVMKADIANLTADKLIVTGTTSGAFEIYISSCGSAATTGKELVTIIETNDQGGDFKLGRNVTMGAWEYALRQVIPGDAGAFSELLQEGSDAYWELYANGLSNESDAAINTFRGAYLLGYAETQTLIQRLGDLRYTPNLNGLWFRVHGGKFDAEGGALVSGFDMDYWGVQFGYDRKMDYNWDGDVYLGIMFGYSKGNLDFRDGGSGSGESKMVGLYGTYKKDNGFYTDLVLKYMWIDNDFDFYNSDRVKIKSDGVTTGGFGASIEIGQRLHFEKGVKTGWYVEPQAQLSYQGYGSDYYMMSGGLHIGAESFSSLLGRLGLLFGYETETTNFYGKISRVKEFKGDMDFYANGLLLVQEGFDDGWWVYGIGLTTKLDDRNSLYFDLERTSGGSFTQKWAVKASWRVLF